MKPCKQCGVVKPLDEFYRHSAMKDGYLNICKVCKRDYQKGRHRDFPDKSRAIDRAKRSRNPKLYRKLRQSWDRNNADKSRALKSGWIARNPEKRRAHMDLHNAIKSGKVKKGPCRDCGSTRLIHGHHEDYSRPLDVIWLCPKCHGKLHQHRRDQKRLAVLR